MRLNLLPVPLALLMACSQDGSPLHPSNAPSAPAASEGAQVNRFDGDPFFFPDFDHGFVYSIGLVTPIEQACADKDHAVFDGGLRIQEVLTPSGRFHIHWMTDRATLVVYDQIPEDPCLLTEADVVGRGTGKFVYNDNDALATGNGSFGFRVIGTLQLASGRATFLAIMRSVTVNGEQR